MSSHNEVVIKMVVVGIFYVIIDIRTCRFLRETWLNRNELIIKLIQLDQSLPKKQDHTILYTCYSNLLTRYQCRCMSIETTESSSYNVCSFAITNDLRGNFVNFFAFDFTTYTRVGKGTRQICFDMSIDYLEISLFFLIGFQLTWREHFSHHYHTE